MNDDFMPKFTWLERLQFWWWGRKKQQCDSCMGTFRLNDLAPCSGDVWLCDRCFKSYNGLQPCRTNVSITSSRWTGPLT